MEEPQLNDVRLGPDGSLEYFDGAHWTPYPDVPEDEGAPPHAVSRHGDDGWSPHTGDHDAHDGPASGAPGRGDGAT
ncbi:hypothetical protein AB0O67_30890 [Streptomyces sp. NPDC086077]|uniref:hypothetical protein n=1 Tax=Streptomyces sp. NPDC086077 TaxID=3154862 RepID=UPI003443C1BB